MITNWGAAEGPIFRRLRCSGVLEYGMTERGVLSQEKVEQIGTIKYQAGGRVRRESSDRLKRG